MVLYDKRKINMLTIKRDGKRITPVRQILEKIKAEGRLLKDDGFLGESIERARKNLHKFQMENRFRMIGRGPLVRANR